MRVKFGVAAGRPVRRAAAPAAADSSGGEEEAAPAARAAAFAALAGNTSANVLGRLASAKSQIASIWETPSDALRQDAAESARALDAAIIEANALLERARMLGASLAPLGRTLGAPAGR